MKKGSALATVVLVVLLASSSFLVVNIRPSTAQTIPTGGTLRLALANTIDNFNQFETSSFEAFYILQDLYPDPRVPLATGLFPVGVASAASNADATVWYFKLRPGMTWSDGVPVNATDLEWTIRWWATPFSWGGTPGTLYDQYLKGGVNSAINAINSTTVEVDLTQSFGTFGDLIVETTPGITPYHVWKNILNDTTAPGNNFGTLVGCGPFYVSDFHQGDGQIVLLKNPYQNSWGGTAQGLPYLDKVVVTLVPSSAQYAILLKGGQIDAAPLGPSDVAAFVGDPRFQINTSPGTGLWYLEFPQDHYPYNMTSFRYALAYAIDKNDLISTAFAGYATPGNPTFLPPTAPDYNSSVPQYAYNTTKAVQLLQGLGFKMGSDGFYTLPNGTSFQPPIYVPTENTAIVSAGALIVRDLQAAGINAQLRPVAGSTLATVWSKGINMYFENTNFGNSNTAYYLERGFYSFLLGGPSPGHAFVDPVASQEFNDTAQGLLTAGSLQQKYTVMKNLGGIIAKALPSIPLFYPNYVWAFNKQNLAGWPVSPSAFEYPGAVWNLTALATLHLPVSSTGTTTVTTGVTLTTTGPGVTVTTTGQSAAGPDYTYLTLGVVVAAIVGITIGVLASRRRRT